MGVGFILFARAYDSTKALLQGNLLLRDCKRVFSYWVKRIHYREQDEVNSMMGPNLRARNLSSACAYMSQLSVFWML